MTKSYDVIVVGGGPAGMMAAARAADLGVRVLLLEKNQSLGKKMLITGGGRCNITNNADINEMVANIPGNGKFVYNALHRFSGQDLRSLFSQLGVRTKVEARGRVFPTSDRAVDVVEALDKYLRQLGVHVRLGTSVSSLKVEQQTCLGVTFGDDIFLARAVIVATGGISYPKTGSTGEGHRMARAAGHNITKLFPSAVSVTSNDSWIVDRQLQGLSLPDVRLTLYNRKGKVLASEIGDVIVTHWGLSGPGALRVGRAVALQKQKEQAFLIKCEIDIFPGKTKDYLEQEINELIRTAGKKSIKNVLLSLMPERLARLVVFLMDYPQDASVTQINKESIKEMVTLLKAFPINITGTRPIEEATVTGGGINVKEINPRTMESKLIIGLFFAGEVLDVDAQTGGFNMQVAFSTGYVAGEAAAAFVREALD